MRAVLSSAFAVGLLPTRAYSLQRSTAGGPALSGVWGSSSHPLNPLLLIPPIPQAADCVPPLPLMQYLRARKGAKNKDRNDHTDEQRDLLFNFQQQRQQQESRCFSLNRYSTVSFTSDSRQLFRQLPTLHCPSNKDFCVRRTCSLARFIGLYLHIWDSRHRLLLLANYLILN